MSTTPVKKIFEKESFLYLVEMRLGCFLHSYYDFFLNVSFEIKQAHIVGTVSSPTTNYKVLLLPAKNESAASWNLWKFGTTTPVVNLSLAAKTGDNLLWHRHEHKVMNISANFANFLKILQWPRWDTRGPEGNWFMKKNFKSKIFKTTSSNLFCFKFCSFFLNVAWWLLFP